MIYRALGVPLLLTSLCAMAAPDDLKMSVSLGLQYRDVVFSDPASPYKSHNTTATASLSRQFDAVTTGSLALNYGVDHARSTNIANSGEIAAGSISASLSHYIGGGRALQGNISYGRAGMSNLNTGVYYKTNADNLSVGAGILQFIPITKDGSGTIGLYYTRVQSRIENYTPSAGSPVGGQNFGSNVFSVSGGLQWKFGPWLPSLNMGLSRASTNMSLSNSSRNSFVYGAGLGYAMGKDRNLSFSYNATAGLKNVKDRSLGVNLSFPF